MKVEKMDCNDCKRSGICIGCNLFKPILGIKIN